MRGADVVRGDTVAYEDKNSTRGYSIGHCTSPSYIKKKVASNTESGLFGALIQVKSMRPLIGHNCEKQWVAGVNKPSVVVPTNRILMTKFSIRRASRVASEADRDEGEDGTIYTINDKKKEVATILRRLDALVPGSEDAQARAATAAAAAAAVVVAAPVALPAVVENVGNDDEDIEMEDAEDVLAVTQQTSNIEPTRPTGRKPSGRGSPNKKRRKISRRRGST